MPLSPTEVPSHDSSTAALTESDRYRLLSSGRRRVLLDVLEERSTPIDLEELAEAVAEREANANVVGTDARRHVAIGLHHNHLPMMEELGVIEYRAEENVVEAFAGELSY